MEEVYRLAFKYERECHCCSRCVVAALQEIFQIKNDEVFSASFALGGGLASTSEGTCGALAGGAIIISYLYGRQHEEFFKGIPNKKEKEIFEKSGGHIDKCPAVVAKTAQWTFKIIEEEINKSKEKGRRYEGK